VLNKKKMFSFDLLKLIGISQEQADRLAGGMIRLESTPGKKYITRCIKLAKDENERVFIWYNIGVKLGIKIEQGMVVPTSVFKQAEKREKKHDDDGFSYA
jgi:hypothetical protein